MPLIRPALIALALYSGVSAHAAIIISEVHSTGNNNSTYAADWIEITNTGASAVNITGWKIDDDSNSFASSLALTGITSIAAGQSVVFVEGTSSVPVAFVNAWFNGTAPAGFAIGTYSGSGIGLGTNGDAVSIFNSAGTLITRVTFGAATTGTTFDNSAGLSGSITALSSVGTKGAFRSFSGSEIGSPGIIPEPSSAAALVVASLLGLRRRRR